jgi:hypothetical protein
MRAVCRRRIIRRLTGRVVAVLTFCGIAVIQKQRDGAAEKGRLVRIFGWLRKDPDESTEITPEINLLDPGLWDSVAEPVQREFLRQAEIMVGSTVTVALGTDSRITTTMSLSGAGGAALIGVVASLVANKLTDWSLICAPAVCAVGLIVAAVICACAIAPTLILIPGASPQNLIQADIADDKGLRADEARLRAALIFSAQRAISHNMTRAIVSTERFTLALSVAGAGILAGIGLIVLWAAHQPF